jgi:dihydrofolate reductase
MRKLKLQMQMTIDGFVAGPNGELDWMEWNWSDDIKKYVNHLHDTVDTILLGRKMTDGFVKHWQSVKPGTEEYSFAKKMVDYPKVVFTKTVDNHNWINTTLAKGDISDEVNRLKEQKGKNIIVYGGAGFVSSLVKENLIDEYYLFINPTAIGKGMEIFKNLIDKMNLKLIDSSAFECGISLLHYEPNRS